MKAAQNFVYGPEDADELSQRIRYVAGDEVPDEVVEALGENADTLILEKALKANPDILSREQLMELAGLKIDELPEEEEEFNEEEFREAMSQFRNKQELVDWATNLGLELNVDAKRDDLEDEIVRFASGQEEDEEDEDE